MCRPISFLVVLAFLFSVLPAQAEVHLVTISCDPDCWATPEPRVVDIRPGDQVQWFAEESCGAPGCQVCIVVVDPGDGFPGFQDAIEPGETTDPTPPFQEVATFRYGITCGTQGGGQIVVRERDVSNLNFFITEATYSFCDEVRDEDLALCEDLVSPPVDDVAFVWVMASSEDQFDLGDGVFALSFGIEYSQADVVSWNLCTGGAEFPEDGWPASGGSIELSWADGCYDPPGQVAKVGYLSVANGATGAMMFAPHSRHGLAWTTCDTWVSVPICPRNAGPVALAAGTDPVCGHHCDDGGTPTIETTWGRIKASYH